MTGRKETTELAEILGNYRTGISYCSGKHCCNARFCLEDIVLMKAMSSGKGETDVPMEGKSSASLRMSISNQIVF
jgi:hypothetical protein